MLIQSIKNIKLNTFLNISQSKKNFGSGLTQLSEDKFEKQVSFKGFPCAQERFELKNLENLPCPSCGKPMIQKSDVRDFIDKVANKTGEELIQTLHEYDNLYRPIEAQAVNEICKMAEKFPEDDLPSLVQMAGVHHLNQLVRDQIKILNRIEGLGLNLPKAERLELSKHVHDAIKFAKMTGNEEGDHFGRKQFLSELYVLTEGFSNEKIVRDIRRAAQDLPNSKSSLSAFFVKYAREDAEKIAARLLTPVTVTTEHIKPQSLGGEDNTANYLVECADCNSKRGSMPYDEWFKVQPNMPKNLQAYLEAIDMEIKRTGIQGYRNYIKDIIKTIKQETKGHVELEDPNEIDYLKENAKDSKQIRAEKIQRVTRLIDENTERLHKLDKTLQDFNEDKEYQDVLRYIYLVKQEEEIRKEKVLASKNLTSIKHEIQSQERRQNKLSQMQKSIAEDKDIMSKKASDIFKLKMSRLQDRIQQDIDLAPTLEEATAHYNELSAAHTKIKEEYKEFKKNFKLPEDFMKEEETLSSQIQVRKDLEKDIKKCDHMMQKRAELQSAIGLAKNELEFKNEENNERARNLDFTSPESVKITKEYKELKTQLRILSNSKLDWNTIYISNTRTRGVSLDFIAQKALQKVEEELEALRNTEVGKYLATQDEIEELEDYIIDMEEDLENMPKLMSTKKMLITRLNKLNQQKTTQELTQELENLMTRHKLLQEKFKYANIQSERDTIIERINELTELLQSLLKQEE